MKIMLTLWFVVAASVSNGQPKSYSFVFLHKKSDAESVAKDKLDKIMQGHMSNIEILSGWQKRESYWPPVLLKAVVGYLF